MITHKERMAQLEKVKRIEEMKYEERKLLKEIKRIKFKKFFDFKKPTTGKMIAYFLFVNYTAVEIYSMVVMASLRDLSSLPTLITCVIGEVMTYYIYCKKSEKENCAGGIVHDIAIAKLDNKEIETDDALG